MESSNTIVMSKGSELTNINTKSVIIFSNSFPNPLQPHRGIYIEQMVAAAGDSINSIIVCPLPWAPKISIIKKFSSYYLYSRIPNEYDYNGHHVYAPKYLVIPKISWLSPISMAISIYPLMKKIITSIKPVLINAQNVFPEGIAAIWLGKRLGVPVVISALGSDINESSNNRIRLDMTVRALQKAKSITAVSNLLCEKIIGMGIQPNKVHYIPNGVDSDLFQLRNKVFCRKKLNLYTKKKILLFVGKFREVKGIEYLLKALGLLKKQNKLGFYTVLIGDGDLKGKINQAINEYALNEQVLLPGNREHNEVSNWMSAADVFCLPSLREGMPNVVLEALSSGLPVVASSVGAIPDLLNDDTGILVPAADHVSLASAIDIAINKEWVPEHIRSSIVDLTWEKTAAKYLDVFFNI